MGTLNAKNTLASYGITQSSWVKIRVWALGVVIVLVGIGLIFWLMQLAATGNGGVEREQTMTKDLLQVAILIVGFVFGYIQWVLARYEASLDRFYDRLDVANRRLGTMVEQAWSHREQSVVFDVYAKPADNVGVSLFDMWVFAELDNLEYVIEKYKWGFIHAAQACRAVDTFKSRCEHDPEFTRRAVTFSSVSGFHKTTHGVTHKIKEKLSQ